MLSSAVAAQFRQVSPQPEQARRAAVFFRPRRQMVKPLGFQPRDCAFEPRRGYNVAVVPPNSATHAVAAFHVPVYCSRRFPGSSGHLGQSAHVR